MNDDPNKNIHISGTVQGGNVNIGGVQKNVQKTVQHNNNSHNSGIQINADRGSTVTTGNISQIINGIPSNTKDQTLDTLLEQLKQALVEAPPGNEKKASKVADSIKEFLDESKKEEPDPDLLAAKGNALKKAAENIKEAIPAILTIATQIVAHVIRLGTG